VVAEVEGYSPREGCEVLWSSCRYVCVSVCLPVCSHISKNDMSKLHKFSVHLTCSRGSLLLWQRCNTLCASGFVDDVIFHITGPVKITGRWRIIYRVSPGGAGGEVCCPDCLVSMNDGASWMPGEMRPANRMSNWVITLWNTCRRCVTNSSPSPGISRHGVHRVVPEFGHKRR